jgi:hypothetical protein
MSVCAAPCGVELSPLNLINGDPVHVDCRCFYRECRAPLIEPIDWERRMCPPCWAAATAGEEDERDYRGQICEKCNRLHRYPKPPKKVAR